MDRLTAGDIAGYRRSLAMSPALTRGETERLLKELEMLMIERQRTAATLARLVSSFAEVRAALNELHGTIRP